MIQGIGADIVEVSRIKNLLERRKDTFAAKVFTSAEISAASGRADLAQYFAGRWAAKEAVSKALGCGIGSRLRMA